MAVIRPTKQWTYGGRPYLSGSAMESTRVDAKALFLVQLRFEGRGVWRPAEHNWGEEGDPIEDWAKPIIASGARPEFVMEQVLPGAGVENPFLDPIGESKDHKDFGDLDGAYQILVDVCQAGPKRPHCNRRSGSAGY